MEDGEPPAKKPCLGSSSEEGDSCVSSSTGANISDNQQSEAVGSSSQPSSSDVVVMAVQSTTGFSSDLPIVDAMRPMPTSASSSGNVQSTTGSYEIGQSRPSTNVEASSSFSVSNATSSSAVCSGNKQDNPTPTQSEEDVSQCTTSNVSASDVPPSACSSSLNPLDGIVEQSGIIKSSASSSTQSSNFSESAISESSKLLNSNAVSQSSTSKQVEISQSAVANVVDNALPSQSCSNKAVGICSSLPAESKATPNDKKVDSTPRTSLVVEQSNSSNSVIKTSEIKPVEVPRLVVAADSSKNQPLPVLASASQATPANVQTEKISKHSSADKVTASQATPANVQSKKKLEHSSAEKVTEPVKILKDPSAKKVTETIKISKDSSADTVKISKDLSAEKFTKTKILKGSSAEKVIETVKISKNSSAETVKISNDLSAENVSETVLISKKSAADKVSETVKILNDSSTEKHTEKKNEKVVIGNTHLMDASIKNTKDSITSSEVPEALISHSIKKDCKPINVIPAPSGSSSVANIPKAATLLPSEKFKINNPLIQSLPIEEKMDESEMSNKSSEVESMEVDAMDILDNNKQEDRDFNISEKLLIGDDESTDSKKPSCITESPLFLDEESCEPILRKPEPVSNICEEAMAGDPRLESQDLTSSATGAMPNLSFSASNKEDTEDADTKDKPDGEEDDDDDEGEDEETVVKKPKKRRKPRRSVFYKPRPNKKKNEKEKGEALNASSTVGVLAGETPAAGSPVTNMDEDSQGSCSNNEKKEIRRFRSEVVVPESTEVFTADKVMEYIWPLEGGYGEHYFIQEHISQYIGISSFKRKYPDLRRRNIDMAERDYLKELGLVSEIACDMGLMAVRSEDLMDVLFTDFPAKFEELSEILRDRRDRQLKERGKVEYQVADIDKSKLVEYGRRAAEEAARYNATLNRDKREERRFSFDLQTFTLHMPTGRGPRLSAEQTRVGHYPVAVLPGQYTDHYKSYTSSELRRLPVNTVCPEPDTAETVAAGLPPTGPASDAPIKREMIAPVKSVPYSEPSAADKLKCKVCHRGKDNNKSGKPEGLIICSKCSSVSHASCVDLNPTMIPCIQSYGWQCMECKNCMQCSSSDDEDKMIFCDLCDRGYHIFCVGLRRVPHGRWHCKECAVCNTCGNTAPNGGEHVKNAEWQHEFKKNKDNNKVSYATTLCVPCDRLWKKRQFCIVCLKVYRTVVEDNMVRCANCPKFVHREKDECSTVHEGEYWCIPCFKDSNSTILNHNRIIAAAKRKMLSGF